MTIFFTKTCARDWERCCYQMLAIRRFFPLTAHIVMIEDAEAAREKNGSWNEQFHVWAGDVSLGGLGPGTMLFSVERYMPEAMKIENPDLRQQYCKLMAPIVFGEDTIQLDSDMCPLPTQWRWADELFQTPGGLIRWNAPLASKAMKPGVENWAKAWLEGLEEDAEVAPDALGLDYMRAQVGWYSARDLARDFVNEVLGVDPVGRILSVVKGGHKFSEYQFLGIYANLTRRYGYAFVERAETDPWLMHFTSKDRLEPHELEKLRKAAGLLKEGQ